MDTTQALPGSRTNAVQIGTASGEATSAGRAVFALGLLAVSYSLRRRNQQAENVPASMR
jgi:MYXO-CTERM domain-containing protein